jgi:hypothetical protein
VSAEKTDAQAARQKARKKKAEALGGRCGRSCRDSMMQDNQGTMPTLAAIGQL